MIELGYIDKNDLIFENKPLKDRINTKLTLLDTDWMTYELEASFRTKTQGELNVRFCGVVEAEMYVKQVSNEIYREYTYFFSSDVFEKYILKFMTHHLEQWKNKEVFYGGDIVLEFYNEVIRLREHRNFHF